MSFAAGFTVLLGIAIPSGLEDDVISHISDLFYDREALTTTLGPSLMNQTNVPASNATDLVGKIRSDINKTILNNRFTLGVPRSRGRSLAEQIQFLCQPSTYTIAIVTKLGFEE